jgi:hypothetical protein
LLRTKKENLCLIKRRKKGALNKKELKERGAKETPSYSRQRRI